MSSDRVGGPTRPTSRAPAARGGCSSGSGAPTPSSRSKWTRPGWMRSSSHRPSGCRLDRTTSTASAIRRIRVRAGAAEVVERAQHVVVPVVRERERRDTPESTTSPVLLRRNRLPLEQVLLAAAAGLATAADPPVARSNSSRPVEHVDRRVERGAHRPVLGLAVPAAVGEPLAEDPLDDRGDVHPEVGAGLDRPAVDARLDLAVEVPLPVVLPAPVLGDERDRRGGPPPTPGRARGSAGSAGCASSPSRAAPARRRRRPPGSRRRRPTARRHPRARGGGRPSPRAPRALARRRPRRARRP